MKQEFKIYDNEMKFEKLSKKLGGLYRDKVVTVNDKKYSTITMYKLINTIFHESRHAFQSNNPESKEFGKCSLDILKPKCIEQPTYAFIGNENLGVNPFYLYIVSDVEYDARNYANNKTKEFLQKLKELASKDNNSFLCTMIDLQIYLMNKRAKRELKIYNNVTADLHNNLSQIKTKSFYFVKDALKEYDLYNQNTLQVNKENILPIKKIKLLLQFYYDDKIEKLLLDKARKENDPYMFSCVVDSIYSNIDESTFNENIKLFIANKNSLFDIKSNLTNWKTKTIQKVYNQLINENNVASFKMTN